MTVVNPKSISGINSITMASGSDNLLTIHSNNTTERVRVDSSGNLTATSFSGDGSSLTGVASTENIRTNTNATFLQNVNVSGTTTATNFIGGGANLTALNATQLTSGTIPDARFPSTLPAVSGANLTGIGGTDFIHAEQISVSGVTTSQAFIPSEGQLSHRNLIINGAMQVAQRDTSSTTNGYTTIDRLKPYTSSIGVTPTYSQVDVTSGGAYNSGFRKAWQVTKGAGTANASSQVNVGYKIEAQDIASSGWKYTDPNSFITFSFWVKTSVSNHNPQVLIQNQDTSTNSTKFFIIDIPTLTANTWTKITQTIPGHANQVYNNDNGVGLEIQIIPWYGTDYTDSGHTTGAWTTFGTKPIDSTWLTTNGSTFQITGLQLEVGSVATPFEHRSFGEELALCQRYYYLHHNTSKSGTSGNYRVASLGFASGTTEATGHIFFPVTMRTTPSLDANSGVTGGIGYWRLGGGALGGDKYIDGAFNVASPTTRSTRIYATIRTSVTAGETGYIDGRNDASYMGFSAEL